MASMISGNDGRNLRLTTTTPSRPGRPQLPRPRPGELFLKGPIPWSWVTIAGQQRGRALHVAVALWHAATLNRAGEVAFPSSFLKGMGVDRFAANRGLAALEKAGLVAVARAPGSKAVVTLLEAPADG